VGPHEATCFENLKMLNNGRERDGKRLSQIADRRRTQAEPTDDLSSDGRRQGVKNQIEPRLIVKHLLKYRSRTMPSFGGSSG